jgi:hypothetical protein
MNKDDIIRMAREAGFETVNEWERHPNGFFVVISRFVHLVYESVFRDANLAASRTILDAAVLEEREACAKVCEDLEEHYNHTVAHLQCAAAIRARGNP